MQRGSGRARERSEAAGAAERAEGRAAGAIDRRRLGSLADMRPPDERSARRRRCPPRSGIPRASGATPAGASIPPPSRVAGHCANGSSTMKSRGGSPKYVVPTNARRSPSPTRSRTASVGLFAFYATAFPAARGALLSYKADTVLPNFFGISQAQFTMGLAEELATNLDPTKSLKYFVEDGQGHVLWGDPTMTTQGETLGQFVTKMIGDDPNWAAVKP